jgi:hypothetical protein
MVLVLYALIEDGVNITPTHEGMPDEIHLDK